MFKRNDRVVGWFGTGVVTDVAEKDNLIRIMQKGGRHGKVSYRYVLKSDAQHEILPVWPLD